MGANQTSLPKHNIDMLSMLLATGNVAELRIPGTHKGTISGYYDDFQKMAADAQRMSGQVAGVYMTLNPVNPALKARAHNRPKEYARETTSDNDILCRRWLPIDFDPVRPAGISSTDSEHEAAIERAQQCKDWLAALGFPEPILADSGNGAHLPYRIALPNDTESKELIEGCLKALDFHFTDSVVKVDTTTGNAARIWKVYGTLACKGDNLPERPHRQAHILQMPSSLNVVPVDLLRELADMAPKSPNMPAQNGRNGHGQFKGFEFDLDSWIAHYHLPVVFSGAWQGGRKWILNPCPFDSTHTNKAAYIVQHANGAIAAGCHHDGCASKGWHDLRTLFEDASPRASIHITHTYASTNASVGINGHSSDTVNDSEADEQPPTSTGVSFDDWPKPPGDAAFDGLAGDVVKAIDPHTEADPIGVLVNFLAAFGSAVGKGPHGLTGATRHDPRIFAALVGKTGRGRKGESWSVVRAVLERADAEWTKNHIHSGISSGEGIIWAVRDPIEKLETRKNKGEPTTYEQVIADEGVSDKRLFVLEPELARVLQTMTRLGNTANSLIRQAWDGDKLESMTKSPVTATDPHIAIVGHITVEELRAELSDINAANGFANRFIWIAVRRSKELPDPEPFEGAIVDELAGRVAERLTWARAVGRMERNSDATKLWKQVYSGLTAEREGLVWSILGRSEAQVLRLSMLYALLDGSGIVRITHLLSALELWGYAQSSALYIFGDATGDPVADAIYRALKRRGRLTRTEISSLFGRNVSAGRISHALTLLLDRGKATMFTEDTGGRPVEIWKVIRQVA